MHMGDGGVECVPLQHIMDGFSAAEKLCGGNNGVSSTSFNLMSFNLENNQTKLKKEEFFSEGEEELATLECDKEAGQGGKSLRELQTEEVEEGELGTLKWPAGDVSSIGSVFLMNHSGDVQKKEHASGECKNGEGDRDSGRGIKEELDKVSSLLLRNVTYGPEKAYCEAEEKACSGCGNLHDKNSSCKILDGQDKNIECSSEHVGEGSHPSAQSNERAYRREQFSSNRSKYHTPDSEERGLKYQADHYDHKRSKIRRLSSDNGGFCTDRHSRHSEESHAKSPPSRYSSYERYGSRRRNSFSSSKASHSKHGSSFSDRSPFNQTRHHDRWHHSPVCRPRSPYDRTYHYNRTSPHSCKSPKTRARHQNRSPYDSSRRRRAGDKRHNASVGKMYVEKPKQKDSLSEGHDDRLRHPGSCSKILVNDFHRRKHLFDDGPVNGIATSRQDMNRDAQSPDAKCEVAVQFGAASEEQHSMEEDMDICNTPPHVSRVLDSASGKWFYLDYHGVERGPCKLRDLKNLVKDGILVSDHLVKHLDSDRWATIENAASPSLTPDAFSVVSDSATEVVIPPEAPGNLLSDMEDASQPGSYCSLVGVEAADSQDVPIMQDDESATEILEDLYIDERVEALLKFHSVLPGMELETLEEALAMKFHHAGFQETWRNFEGFTWHETYTGQLGQKANDISHYSEKSVKVSDEHRLITFDGKQCLRAPGENDEWLNSLWPCKGGDWIRGDETMQDKCGKKKLVLNHGFPLCQMPKSLGRDPRWHHKDELYNQSYNRKLHLPSWAFYCADESNELDGFSKSAQAKPFTVRGGKGSPLPVIKINACVAKDPGSFVFEPLTKEQYVLKPARSPSLGASDGCRSLKKSSSTSSRKNEQDLHKFPTSISTPKDHVCTVEELQLHLGDWYYIDGVGHECGPFTFPDVHNLVDHGIIPKSSSVFRKHGKVWVPANTVVNSAHSEFKIEYGNGDESGDSSLFHSMHPQFVGFMRGKLHELVVKSYRSREFAAAINEVLDPWINGKQPKKEMEKHLFNAGITSVSHFKKTDVDFNGGIFVGGIDDDNDLKGPAIPNDEFTFDDLCADVSFCNGYITDSDKMRWTWGLLDGIILARIFHFLRNESKSLIFASLTCKHWKAAVRYYKDVCRKVDLSSLGPSCSDSMVQSILNGYNKEKLTSVVLAGCTSLSSQILQEILGSFKSLSSVDIRGCSQLADLPCLFPDVNWIKGYSSRCLQALDETNTKMRNLKHINDTFLPYRKTSRASVSDDFNELKDYFESVDKRDAAKQMFRKNLYKRSKLFDARNSSSILSRDARIRRWAMIKPDNGYNRMSEFLAFSLKSIMRDNSFDFFKPKVAEIEERMKNGYYARRGLKYVREDIGCMCKEAIKEKYHDNDGNMNHIITLFVDLAIRLEDNFKLNARVLTEFSSKYKKITTLFADRKCFINGGSDSRVYVSGREVRKKLSELNKRLYGSGSELSDDLHCWSGDSESETDITGSDRESDLDVKEEVLDGGLHSLMGDREWGARMTEVSLVPPVTRKYEVIDEYVIVVDEDDVRRKMQVSLPEDYFEKLGILKGGIEESEDMEIPEVKDFKPRKKLGDEVIEQEVYGIDPYTHNLLLDSMPDDQEWPLFEKHLFIEDLLLRTLNHQVQQFTCTGHPPMTYPLRHVVEEIQRIAEKDRDRRTANMCLGLLESMDCRSNDKYVAYRKGLGVVCNRNGGFSEDDFVVEFLGEVYPAWKWFEKQDGIRSLQKDSDDPAPEFYNIYLERPKGDADGYDLVVVDAMHKANYASRICHSCRPNCEAKVTAVNGQYQIGIYTVRHIQYGEEITFDYNSVTESKEEYEASVCLCGSRVCRGSYLNLTGEGAFLKVLKERHGLLDRIQLMVEACEVPLVSEGDYIDLGKAGLGSCLLGGLPDWLIAYSARLVRFINLERSMLPDEILRYNLEEKRKFFSDICIEVESSDAQVQAEGVFNQRLQNLALTLDKVSYVMKCVFGDAKKAPPPLERLSGKGMAHFLWKGEGSIVDEVLTCISPQTDDVSLDVLKAKIHAQDPSNSEDLRGELKKSLLWLRDEVQNLPCTHKCRHDAAADMIHIYAHTKSFFRVRKYKSITSPPVFISPLDLGPKYCDKIGPGLHEYQKTYGENYCLGQLMYWYNQTSMDPDLSLTKASRGCLVLPEMGSFYTKVDEPLRRLVYGPRIVRSMLGRMEKQPQRPWPEDGICTFDNELRVIGTPMLDAVLPNCELDRDMVQWLRTRPAVFNSSWDQ